jgi:hypothetical protein
MPGRATPFGLPAVVPKAQDVWPGYLNDASLVSPPADSQAPGVNRPGLAGA